MQDGFQDSDVCGTGVWRKSSFIILAVLALCASALAGAWVHARYFSAPGLSAEHEQLLVGQASRNAAYIRENIGLLARKVGALQAKVVAVNGLTHRVAQAAGVHYTEPELVAILPSGGADNPVRQRQGEIAMPLAADASVMDDMDPAAMTAESLGRQLDALHHQLVTQEDSLALLDLMLTRRTGIDASLPEYMPVDYPYLSSSFGWRRHPVTGRHSMHEGLDFAAPTGTPIYAAAAGVVTQARFRAGYGKLVEIAHGNGLSTRYAHASRIDVKEGDLVEKGQVIALVGATGRATGPHLHFEVRMAGHPLDPSLFLPAEPASGSLVANAGEHAVTNAVQVR